MEDKEKAIQWLKENKTKGVVLQFAPDEVKELIKKDREIPKLWLSSSGWVNTYALDDNMYQAFSIPEYYQPEKLLEFDIEDSGSSRLFQAPFCSDNKYLDINAKDPDIYGLVDGKKYKFCGYMFDNSDKIYATWIRYERKNQNNHLFSVYEHDTDKIRYANKAVYMKVDE